MHASSEPRHAPRVQRQLRRPNALQTYQRAIREIQRRQENQTNPGGHDFANERETVRGVDESIIHENRRVDRLREHEHSPHPRAEQRLFRFRVAREHARNRRFARHERGAEDESGDDAPRDERVRQSHELILSTGAEQTRPDHRRCGGSASERSR